jgi:hypothetical protein
MHTRKPGTIVTLRYVGKTKLLEAPIVVFIDDATRVSVGSRLLRCFLSALQENFPDVSEAGCSYGAVLKGCFVTAIDGY